MNLYNFSTHLCSIRKLCLFLMIGMCSTWSIGQPTSYELLQQEREEVKKLERENLALKKRVEMLERERKHYRSLEIRSEEVDSLLNSYPDTLQKQTSDIDARLSAIMLSEYVELEELRALTTKLQQINRALLRAINLLKKE